MKRKITDLLAGHIENEKVENNDGIIILPQPYSTVEKAMRAVSNSATFDQKSYEADGGDEWIDSRRELFFDRDKAKDTALWDQAHSRCIEAYGEYNWKFVVNLYKKLGGKF